MEFHKIFFPETDAMLQRGDKPFVQSEVEHFNYINESEPSAYALQKYQGRYLTHTFTRNLGFSALVGMFMKLTVKLSLESEFIFPNTSSYKGKNKKGFGKQLQVPVCVYTLGKIKIPSCFLFLSTILFTFTTWWLKEKLNNTTIFTSKICETDIHIQILLLNT